MSDVKLSHAREFTDLEAGANAGAVGFWFRAVQAGDPALAQEVWDKTIFAEHYLSLLAHDPAERTAEETATLAALVADAKDAQARVAAAEAPTPFVQEHDQEGDRR